MNRLLMFISSSFIGLVNIYSP